MEAGFCVFSEASPVRSAHSFWQAWASPAVERQRATVQRHHSCPLRQGAPAPRPRATARQDLHPRIQPPLPRQPRRRLLRLLRQLLLHCHIKAISRPQEAGCGQVQSQAMERFCTALRKLILITRTWRRLGSLTTPPAIPRSSAGCSGTSAT